MRQGYSNRCMKLKFFYGQFPTSCLNCPESVKELNAKSGANISIKGSAWEVRSIHTLYGLMLMLVISKFIHLTEPTDMQAAVAGVVGRINTRERIIRNSWH